MSPENPAVFEAPATPERPEEAATQATATPAGTAAPAPIVQIKDEVTLRVESILEEDLAEAYGRMTEPDRRRFKIEGERVTREIVSMISRFRIKLSKVLKLLTGWLKLIPGANRFFVIQEAKLKADRILAIAEEEKSKRPLI
jgi:hypothetical protein